MLYVRKADVRDASRLAEILVFAKRMNYRHIFCNDAVSFGEMQVLPLAQDYINNTKKLDNIWVYDDVFVKGMVHIEGDEVRELYVDSFFQGAGIGTKLFNFACQEHNAAFLWVLEKNCDAIRFYKAHGFVTTKERVLEQGTSEFILKMIKK